MKAIMSSVLAGLLLLGLAGSNAGAQPPEEGWGPGSRMEKGRMGKFFGERGKRGFFGGELREKKIMEFLSDNVPEMCEELQKIKEEMPGAFRKALLKIGHAVRLFQKQKDPEARKKLLRALRLGMETRRLAKEYRQAESKKEKADLKKKISENLKELFDLKLFGQELRVKHMEKEIAKLKEKTKKRKANKKKIIERRLGELTGDIETWDW